MIFVFLFIFLVLKVALFHEYFVGVIARGFPVRNTPLEFSCHCGVQVCLQDITGDKVITTIRTKSKQQSNATMEHRFLQGSTLSIKEMTKEEIAEEHRKHRVCSSCGLVLVSCLFALSIHFLWCRKEVRILYYSVFIFRQIGGLGLEQARKQQHRKWVRCVPGYPIISAYPH